MRANSTRLGIGIGFGLQNIVSNFISGLIILAERPIAIVGEFVRQKRIDLGLSQRKLAEILDIGVTDTAVEKWEKNQNRPTESHQRRIIEFLGFDPATTIPTGGS